MVGKTSKKQEEQLTESDLENIDLSSLTVEQLVALDIGYTTESAQAFLDESKGDMGSSIPFEIAKIWYSPDFIPEFRGTYVAGVEKNDEDEACSVKHEFGKTPEMRILKVGCQWSKFNLTTGKAEISSNILPTKDSKKCVDLKTGERIEELKKIHGKDLKYSMVSLAVMKDIKTEEWIPVITYIKGSFLYSFNTAFKQNDYLSNVFKFNLKKVNGAVVYFVADNTEIIPLSKLDILKNGAKDGEYIKAFDEWVASVNGSNFKDVKDAEIDSAIDVYSDTSSENKKLSDF